MNIESRAFPPGSRIPQTYTCDGDRRLSPPLTISEIPEQTQSLALIMDDPDVPVAIMSEGLFTHWILFNIPPETLSIPEGGTVGTPGANTRGDMHYTGPCPPPDHEPRTHRYIFKLYALDTEIELEEGASKEEVEAEMEGHTLATAELIGTYSRK